MSPPEVRVSDDELYTQYIEINDQAFAAHFRDETVKFRKRMRAWWAVVKERVPEVTKGMSWYANTDRKNRQMVFTHHAENDEMWEIKDALRMRQED